MGGNPIGLEGQKRRKKYLFRDAGFARSEKSGHAELTIRNGHVKKKKGHSSLPARTATPGDHSF